MGIDSNRYKVVIGSILNKNKISRVMEEEKPDIIIHAAAYKHVNLMEENVDEAILTNLEGSKNVIDVAIEKNIKNFIFISTDKVVNPKNIMGATQRLIETYIQKKDCKNTKINIVRFGNVIKSNGSVIEIWEDQLKKGDAIMVAGKEVKRFFIAKSEAVKLVLIPVLQENSKEVFILNMGNLIPTQDIALCMIRARCLVPNIDIKIKYMELGTGEKVSEDLFTQEEWENVELMQNNHIYRLKKFVNRMDNVEEILEKLINDAKSQKSQHYLRQQFEQLFPTLKNGVV